PRPRPAATRRLSLRRSVSSSPGRRRTACGPSPPPPDHLSDLSGILKVPYRVFIPCAPVSAMIWAAIFPRLSLGLGVLVIGYFGYEDGFKPKTWRGPVEDQQ